MTRWARALRCCAVAVLALVALAGSQAQVEVPRGHPPGWGDMGPDEHQLKEMATERQKRRYKEMKGDSLRLLELATELKKAADGDAELNPSEAERKLEQIEKLAHSVKNKMRGEY